MVRWHHVIGSAGLIGGLLLITTAALPVPLKHLQAGRSPPSAETLFADLADGAYQLCTEPAPTDWRDGAGACLNIVKQDTMIDGYYGYPHSESFVCLQGEVLENEFQGQGFVISWPGNPWTEIPHRAFNWDEEGRLSLAQASVTRHEGDVSWITFQQADLDMRSLYLYPSPRMNPPAQVCEWRATSDGEL